MEDKTKNRPRWEEWPEKQKMIQEAADKYAALGKLLYAEAQKTLTLVREIKDKRAK